MPVSASLAASHVDVMPGGSANVELTVRNTGSVVDEFTVEVLGAAAAWTTPSPAVVRLFPGATAPVVLTFSPPRAAAVTAGDLDVAVKLTSKEDPDGSSVEEFVVTVGAFDAPDAELIPRTARGSRGAKVQVAVDNHGNRRSQRSVTATDPDQALRIDAKAPSIVVEPGRAEFVDLALKPAKTFLRGPDRTLPYKVVLADGDSSVQLDGTFVQTAMLPKWLLRLLLLLLLGLLALLALWQLALKPVIRSSARAAAEKQVDQAATKAATQTAQALGATPAAAGGGGAAGGGAAGGGSGGGGSGDAGGAGGGSGGGGAGKTGGDDGRGGTSLDKRLAVEVKPGETGAANWKPGGDKDRFSLADVVLQNPHGDSGVLRVKRGDDILLESALENFRDLDFHFIAPYIVQGKELVLEVQCTNPADGQPCRDAVTLGGFLAAGS